MMVKNVLKVYDEDLINDDVNKTSIAEKSVVAAGDTQGALCVNVFAEEAITTASVITVTVKHGDSENGSFADLLTLTVPADKSFAKGELAATATLPQDTKSFVKATATSAATNSGKIRVTLGYLAR